MGYGTLEADAFIEESPPADYSPQQFHVFGGGTAASVDAQYKNVLEQMAGVRQQVEIGLEPNTSRLEAALAEFRRMQAGVQTLMAPHLREAREYLALVKAMKH